MCKNENSALQRAGRIQDFGTAGEEVGGGKNLRKFFEIKKNYHSLGFVCPRFSDKQRKTVIFKRGGTINVYFFKGGTSGLCSPPPSHTHTLKEKYTLYSY